MAYSYSGTMWGKMGTTPFIDYQRYDLTNSSGIYFVVNSEEQLEQYVGYIHSVDKSNITGHWYYVPSFKYPNNWKDMGISNVRDGSEINLGGGQGNYWHSNNIPIFLVTDLQGIENYKKNGDT